MSFFAHGKNIRPIANYLGMMSTVYVTWEEEEKKNPYTHTPKRNKRQGKVRTYLNSSIIILYPAFLVVTVSKTMIVLTIIANLQNWVHILQNGVCSQPNTSSFGKSTMNTPRLKMTYGQTSTPTAPIRYLTRKCWSLSKNIDDFI